MRTRFARTTLFAALMLAACSSDRVTQPTATPTPLGSGQGPSQVSYSLDGWVADTAGRLIDGVTVQILSGPHAGEVRTTGPDGRFAFDGPFTAIPEAQASKPGYLPAGGNVFILPGTTTIRGLFRLGSPNRPADLGGTYQLTFTADPSCALPAEARSRSYTVSVSSNSASSYLFRLGGASFVHASGGYDDWNVIYVGVFENVVTLYFSDPPIWERLDQPTSLYIVGSAQGEVTGPVSRFPVDGEFEFCGVTANGQCEEEVECDSRHHSVTLTRR